MILINMNSLLLIFFFILQPGYSLYRTFYRTYRTNIKRYSSPNSDLSKNALLPDPVPNSIGNFFDNSTESVSFIQCYMLTLGMGICNFFIFDIL